MTSNSKHKYGNAEDCPVCSKRDDIEYPWVCRDPDVTLHACGYVEDTFACKIRHLQINTGAVNSNVSRWDRAADMHNKKQT